MDPPTSAEVQAVTNKYKQTNTNLADCFQNVFPQIGLIMVAKTNALCGKDASKEELEAASTTYMVSSLFLEH